MADKKPRPAPEFSQELVDAISLSAYENRFDTPEDFAKRLAKVGPEGIAAGAKAYDSLTRAYLKAFKKHQEAL